MIKNYFGKFGGSLDWPFNVSGRGKISDPFGDYDRDGVHNLNDCSPRNPKKQDKMMSSISKIFTPAQKLPTYPATKININSEIIKRIEPTPGKKYPIFIDDSSLKPLTPSPSVITKPEPITNPTKKPIPSHLTGSGNLKPVESKPKPITPVPPKVGIPKIEGSKLNPPMYTPQVTHFSQILNKWFPTPAAAHAAELEYMRSRVVGQKQIPIKIRPQK